MATRKIRPSICVGDRFGRLIVEGEAPPHRTPGGTIRPRWVCRCDCGAITTTLAVLLRGGRTQSCGCWRDESRRLRKVHGHAGRSQKQGASAEYRIWAGMVQRCTNPKTANFYLYGGRGVRVCDRWRRGDGERGGFECFLADIGPRPSSAHSLDRYPNGEGDYELGNVRWATNAEQTRNTRRNVLLALNGETKVLADWAREYGIDAMTLKCRLRAGHSLADALTMPLHKLRKRAAR